MKKFFTSVKVIALVGLFLFSVNAQWVEKDIGSLAWLRSIYFVDNDNGWIVGSKGTIFKSINGGETWTRVEWKSDDLIRDVFFLDSSNGWLLCERDQFSVGKNAASYVLQTTDGGQTWTQIESPDNSIRMLRFVYAKDRLAFVVGEKGTIWIHDQGLKKFQSSYVGVSYMLTDGVSLGGTSWLLVGGGGTILKSSDNGKNWEPKLFPAEKKVKLNAVTLSNGQLYAVGNKGTLLFSHNLGNSWTMANSGTERDLFDIKSDINGKSIAVGDQGIILSTTDLKNWSTHTIKGDNPLNRIGVIQGRPMLVGFAKLLIGN